jgi:hypothetical protein
MDQDTIRAVVQEAYNQAPYQIDWSPVLWLCGIVFSIITGLLTWIGYLIKSERSNFIYVQTKHEKWILENREDIKELAIETKEALAQNRTSIEFIKEIISKKRR